MPILVAFGCGLIFGAGLLISGMTDTQKVLGFLDVLGSWDPSLAFVMAGALAVTGAGYALARRGAKPMLAARHLWPDKRDIDRPLLVGAALFGIGWGLVGLCPGPALENLATGSAQVIVFVGAVLVGMLSHQLWTSSAAAPPAGEAADG